MAIPLRSSIVVIVVATTLFACSDGQQEVDCGEKCDALGKLACDVQNLSGWEVDNHGRPVEGLADPVAEFGFRGDGCASSLEDMAARLVANGCNPGADVRVDELKDLDGFGERTIRRMSCRDSGEVFLSSSNEVMAFDPNQQAYNYYLLAGGEWSFHGSSIDLLAGSSDSGLRGCADCHSGGGPVMKELRTPWVHWQGGPGSRLLMATEGHIRGGTGKWTPTRVSHAIDTMSVADTLRPLFCTTEFNLATQPADITGLPMDLLVNPPWNRDADFAIIVGAPVVEAPLDFRYSMMLASDEVNQRMESAEGVVIKDANDAIVRDLEFPLMYPHRSDADNAYVRELINRSFVTERFANDVRMVDMTRPVFSDPRCNLMAHAPDTPANQVDAASIMKSFRDSLEAQETLNVHERQMLDALVDEASDEEHRSAQDARVDSFVAACAANQDLTMQAIKVASQLRNQVRHEPLIELRSQMPVDDLNVDSNARLDEADCMLVP